MRRLQTIALPLLLGISAAAGNAFAQAAGTLALSESDAQRLGVRLAAPVAVERVPLAAAPALVVVPPAQQRLVSTQAEGVVAELLAAVGDEVQAGQVLARLHSPALLQLQRDFLDAAAGDELAQAQLRRDRELHEAGIIATRRLEETGAQARGAALRLAQARQLLELAGLTGAELAALRAQQRLAPLLALRAPITGSVLEQFAGTGTRVETMAPVYRLADLSRLWLELRLPAERAAALRIGMPVEIVADGGMPVGSLIHIAQVVDPVAQTVLVRAEVAQDARRLRAGQYVDVRVSAGDGGAFAVPQAALSRTMDGQYLFVRTAAGFASRAVEPIADDGSLVYLRAGVTADERVAVDGVAALKALWLGEAGE